MMNGDFDVEFIKHKIDKMRHEYQEEETIEKLREAVDNLTLDNIELMEDLRDVTVERDLLIALIKDMRSR